MQTMGVQTIEVQPKRVGCNPKEWGKKNIVHYKAIVKIMGVQTIEVQPKSTL